MSGGVPEYGRSAGACRALAGRVLEAAQRDRTTREPALRQAGVVSGKLLLALAVAVLVFVLLHSGTIVRVRSAGMVPALLSGDYVYVYTRAYSRREPARGEVVAFRLAVEGKRRYAPDRRPELPTESFLGRIIGIPGDTVESRESFLRLNGDRVRRERVLSSYRDPDGRRLRFHRLTIGSTSFVVARDRDRPEAELAPTKVEEGRYLVLGDYRSEAYDSRYWGTVRRSDLLGRAMLVLFSRSPRTRELRWSRVGKVVE